MRKIFIIFLLLIPLAVFAQNGLRGQIERAVESIEEFSVAERGALLRNIFASLPAVSTYPSLTPEQIKGFSGILNAGIFEEVEISRVGKVAGLGLQAMLNGADPTAVNEAALMGFSLDLDGPKLRSAAQALKLMQSAEIPSDIYRQAISYAIYNGWTPENILGFAQGVVRGKAENIPLDKLTLSIIIRVDQGLGGIPIAQSVEEEIAYIRGLRISDPERARLDSIYASMKTAVLNGVPEFIAKDFYYNAAEEGWSADDSDKLFYALAEGVRKGLTPEKLALAFIIRMEIDYGKVPIETIIRDESEYVKKHFALKKEDEPYTPPVPHSREIRVSLNLNLMVKSIQSFVGTPYVWGGETRRGTDCSGFTRTVFNEQGVIIPRVSYQQFTIGANIRQKDLKYGDLIFFNKNGWGRVSHVGIYVGNGRFAHASCSKGVTVSNLAKRYYNKRFTGARRVIS
ncbi:MAG: C40 family peptidase [candidate division Zixibacteria bacterium]|nr:C40 family peptidase [Candidatus Tariuqbacter arcticus]